MNLILIAQVHQPVINIWGVENFNKLFISLKKSETYVSDFLQGMLSKGLTFKDSHIQIFFHSFFNQFFW